MRISEQAADSPWIKDPRQTDKGTDQMKNKDKILFTTIAPVYGLFFNYQKRRYRNLLREVQVSLDLPSPTQILDVGCGTGALASVLYELGHQVTGIDASWKMIDIARRKTAPQNIVFQLADGTEKLPFQDKSFQVAMASFVAHGLQPEARRKLYGEMERVSSNYIILSDYNQQRNWLVSLAEYLEGGDYFEFIQVVEKELEERFGNLKIIPTGKRSALYVVSLT